MKITGKAQAAPKRFLSLLAIGFLSGNAAVLAQESPDSSPTSGSSPEIIGAINTGENLANLPTRVGVGEQPRARIRFQPVAPPSDQRVDIQNPKPARSTHPRPTPPIGDRGQLFLFPVEANRHHNDLFHVKVHHRGQVHSFWSNIDWQNLDVISGIRDRRDSFHFLLFVKTINLKDPGTEDLPANQADPANLPALNEKDPYFTLAAGTNEQEIPPEVFNFLEATHQLYHEREAELAEATRQRKINRAKFHQRQREARQENPAPPEDIVVQFWHSKPKPLPPHLRRTSRKETDR